MKHLILAMPRAGGDALALNLGGTSSADAGPLLRLARRHDVSIHAEALHAVTFGHKSWDDAVKSWSWLINKFPDSEIILLTREEDARYEIDLEVAWKDLQPGYGKCPSRVLRRTREHREWLRDFNAMNPTRTRLVDFSELSLPDPEVLPTTLPDDHPWHADPFADAPAIQTPLERGRDPFAAPPKPFVQPETKPKPFRNIPAKHPRALVIPWLRSAAVWDELRYCLRSIHAHWPEDCPIYIIGEAPPKWLRPGGRVQHITVPEYRKSRRAGYFRAQEIGLQLADEVAWWNDDIYLIRDSSWDDLRVAVHEGRIDIDRHLPDFLASPNSWLVGLGNAALTLFNHRSGDSVFRYATHTPFLFEREKSLEIQAKFPVAYKGARATLYHNWHRTPSRPIGTLKARALPAPPEAIWLNHNDRNLTDDLKAAIQARFPDPAPWELL